MICNIKSQKVTCVSLLTERAELKIRINLNRRIGNMTLLIYLCLQPVKTRKTTVQRMELTCVQIISPGPLKIARPIATFVVYVGNVSFTFRFSKWAASSEFGTYRLSRQNLRCSLIQAMNQEEPSDRKPDPWPLWMAGHAQLNFYRTECSKTQTRLTRPVNNHCP